MFKNMLQKRKRNEKGFTLVELMVVVVIIGVLTAIAVPVYNNATSKAKLNAIAANLRIINGAISQYQMEKGDDPASTEPDSSGGLAPDYIQTWPDGNPKGAAYSIKSGGTIIEGQVEIEKKIGKLEAGAEITLADVLEAIGDEEVEGEG